MINIRDIQPTDVETMLALRERWLSRRSGAWKTTERERAWFARYPGNEMAPALVAVDGDQIVAYVLCALMTHPAMSGVLATIDEVCVAETHRRQGIGRQLVDDLRGRLRSMVNDLNAIRALVDHEDDVAKAFCAALGFEHDKLEFTDYLE